MLTPVPNQVADPKDAVLWSLFDRLQKIDEHPSARMAFAVSIAYASQNGGSSPVFKDELDMLRDILKLPPEVIVAEIEDMVRVVPDQEQVLDFKEL